MRVPLALLRGELMCLTIVVILFPSFSNLFLAAGETTSLALTHCLERKRQICAGISFGNVRHDRTADRLITYPNRDSWIEHNTMSMNKIKMRQIGANYWSVLLVAEADLVGTIYAAAATIKTDSV